MMMKKCFFRTFCAGITAAVLLGAMIGCSKTEENGAVSEKTSVQRTETATDPAGEETTVTIFAAKSLNGVIDELIDMYQETHPGVKILANYDSSGTLMVQIEEGADCDIFFSAAQAQMDQLEGEALILTESRQDLLHNQVCLVTYPNSGTPVTGLADIGKAQSIALADGSVPVGAYTRKALVAFGILAETDKPEEISAEEISEALGGVTINTCSNVGAVAVAVSEGANEIGTVYSSDLVGYADKLEIIEVIDEALTGEVNYPVARVINPESSHTKDQAADDFLAFLTSDEAKEVYLQYGFR